MNNLLIANLARVARVLAPIPERFVFTGGATIVLYLEEILWDEVRRTLDVDCVVEIGSLRDYYRLAEQLRGVGLEEDQGKDAPLCRWRYDDLIIDVMPCYESVLGFTNRWYPEAIAHRVSYSLPDGQEIWIFPPIYFLASKIEALEGRGGDWRYSKDMEDIVLLLDGCEGLLADFAGANPEVQKFLRSWFQQNRERLGETVCAFLPSSSEGREDLIFALLDELCREN